MLRRYRYCKQGYIVHTRQNLRNAFGPGEPVYIGNLSGDGVISID